MTGTIWVAAAVLVVGTLLIRLGGLAIGDRLRHGRYELLLDHSGIVMIVCVAATTAVFDGNTPSDAAHIGGVAAGAVLAWRRAPIVVVLAAAAVVTAILRHAV